MIARASREATPSTRWRQPSGKTVTRSVVGAALLAAVSGCPHRPPIERPYPAPTADELRAFLRDRDATLRTLNGRAKLTSWLGGERIRSTVYVLVDRPHASAMRFEAEVSLQGTVAILTTDGTRFSFLDVQKNVLRTGPSCPENIASLVRMPLASADVALVLMGAGALPDAPPGAVSWDAKLGADVLTVGDRAIAFKKRGADWELVSFEGPSAKGRFKVLYEDMETIEVKAPARWLRQPSLIRFAEDGKSFDDGVEVAWKERTLNDDIAADRFQLTAPAGAHVEEVDCPTSP